MAIFSIPGVKLAGIATSIPQNEVRNMEFATLPEAERHLFVRTTGIDKRRVAKPGTCTSDLCEVAARQLMEAMHWQPSDIQVLVFLSQTPDYITPATAIILQDKLGLPKSCMAFDINLGCSGYPYGLSVVAALLRNMPGAKGLFLAGDVSSACLSEKDKSTAPIFSDAGSATALVQDDMAPDMHFNLETDGRGYDAIIIPHGGYRNPLTAKGLEMSEEGPGIVRSKNHLVIKGINVFNFSVLEAPQNVKALLEHLRLERDEVDYYVFHQANMVINESIRKKLGLLKEQTPQTLSRFGNTSSATIPLTITSELQSLITRGPCRLLLSGFGVGLSWGAAVVQTEGLICLPVLEVDL
ncbi:ketoacyl-ACP synthase III [soil metagenome]